MLQVILDDNVRHLIDTLAAKLSENPNLALDDIDVIISEIQETANKQALVEASEKEKSNKKPALEKA